MNEKRQDHSFPTPWFQFRVMVAGASLGSSGCRGDPPWTGRPSTAGPLTRPHSLRQGQCRHADSPHWYVFRVWEEPRIPGENPHRHGEDMQSPHWQWTCQESIFCLNNVIKNQWRMKWCYLRTCFNLLPWFYKINYSNLTSNWPSKCRISHFWHIHSFELFTRESGSFKANPS